MHNFFSVTGKSPLFEIRHMDTEGYGSLKLIPMLQENLIEESDDSLKSISILQENYVEETEVITSDKERCDEVESDEEEEDEDYRSKQSKTWKSIGTESKRKSPVCVYTCKVN